MSTITGIGADASDTKIRLGGEIQVHAERRRQTGYSGTPIGGWALMVYGNYDNLYRNINQQLGGDWINDSAWTKSVDEPGVYVYGDNESNEAMAVDWIHGTVSHKTTEKLAKESGIGSDDGTPNFNYALWTAGNLQFVANQNAEGVAPGSTNFDLTQPAFGSKWNSDYVINNVDFNKVAKSGTPTDAASLFATNIFQQSMYTIGQWGSKFDVDKLNSSTSTTDYYNKAIEILKNHSFKVAKT